MRCQLPLSQRICSGVDCGCACDLRVIKLPAVHRTTPDKLQPRRLWRSESHDTQLRGGAAGIGAGSCLAAQLGSYVRSVVARGVRRAAQRGSALRMDPQETSLGILAGSAALHSVKR